MKNRNLIVLALMAAFAIPIQLVVADSTPSGPTATQETLPGPQSGPAARPDRPRLSPEQREKLRAMTPAERQKFFQERRANCLQAAGTTTACPQRLAHPRMSLEQRDKVNAMTPEQRQQFFQEMRASRMQMRHGGGLDRPGAGAVAPCRLATQS